VCMECARNGTVSVVTTLLPCFSVLCAWNVVDMLHAWRN